MKSSSNNVIHPPGKRFFHGWYLVAVTWVTLFLASAVGVGIFFKPILEEFGWDRTTLSLVHTSALLVFAAVSPFLGRIIDRFGPKLMLYVCVGTQTLSSVANGLAGSIWHLFIGRLFLDIKGMHAGQVLVNRWFVKKRGQAQGIVATGMPVGMLLLSPLSQYMVLTWGWRETLLCWAGIFFVTLLPLTVFIKENPEDAGFLPDDEGIDSHSAFDPASQPETGLPARSEAGSIREIFRTASFWLLSGTQLFCGIGCGFMMTHIVIFATDIGYSPMIGATFLSIQGGVNLAGVLVTGYMSDRVARSRVLAMTHLIRSLSFFTVVVAVLAGGGSLWMLYIAMALFGFGFFTTAPLASGLVADLFGYSRMGVLLGIILSCHMLGTALGAYAGGFIFESTGSYYLFFFIQGFLELFAVLFAFVMKRQPAH